MAKRRQGSRLDMQLLGRRIREKRKAAGLSQEDLAGRMECSVSYISKLESGKATCSVHRLAEAADLLGCDAAELLLGINAGSGAYLARELAEKYDRLAPLGKQTALGLVEALLNQQQYRKETPPDDLQ